MFLLVSHLFFAGVSIFDPRDLRRNVTAIVGVPVVGSSPSSHPNRPEPGRTIQPPRGGKRAQKNLAKAVLIKPKNFLLDFATFFSNFCLIISVFSLRFVAPPLALAAVKDKENQLSEAAFEASAARPNRPSQERNFACGANYLHQNGSNLPTAQTLPAHSARGGCCGRLL